MTRRIKKRTPKHQKHCLTCDRILDIEQFTWANRKANKRRHQCRDCRNQHRWFLRRVELDRAELLQLQDGKCAICKVDAETSCLSIDHNHKTLEIRGLLCADCNSGIAYFDDNPQYLIRAAIYLIGGQDAKAITDTNADADTDIEYDSGVPKLRKKTGDIQGVSLFSRAMDEGVELEARG